MASRAAACVALASSVFLAAPAQAYVRARTTNTFKPTFWRDPAQVLEVATPPDGLGISTNDLRHAARAALETWSYPQISCTATSLRVTSETTESQVSGRDGTNRIIMRVDAWCRDPVAMTNCDRDPDAVALTTTFNQSRPGAPDDGEILEADIEINAVDHSWAVIPDPFSARDYLDIFDLTSVLTHEAGHFIGLGHNCHLSPADPFLIDDQGVPQPDCSAALPKAARCSEGTMYPLTYSADLRLRTLTADDKRAACEMYPLWSGPLDDWAGGAACSLAPGQVSSPASRGAVLVLLLLALGRIWRRRPPPRV